MAKITVYNKGKRTWSPKQVKGLEIDLEPQGSAEMDEALGRRFAMNYPRDITTNGVPVVSSSDISRREQSVNDREENLKAWEATLKEREAKLSKPLTDSLVDAGEYLDGKPPRSLGEIVSDIMPYLSEEAQAYLSEDNSAWVDGEVPTDIVIEQLPDTGDAPPDAMPKRRGRKPKAAQ
jgi:hypothetical protein